LQQLRNEDNLTPFSKVKSISTLTSDVQVFSSEQASKIPLIQYY